MAQFNRVPVREPLLAGPGDEFVQQGGVGPLRVLCLAALVAEILEEVFDQGLHQARHWPWSGHLRAERWHVAGLGRTDIVSRHDAGAPAYGRFMRGMGSSGCVANYSFLPVSRS